jgi:cytochrome c oxidase subunit 2
MNTDFRLWPQSASSYSGKVDTLYAFLLLVSAFFTLLIFILILYFGLKYRRRPGVVPVPVPTNFKLEITWTVIPLLITLVMFTWGAKLMIHMERPPAGAMDINVVAKQWMWKVEHPQGRREINELHIPTGVPIRLLMTSQDVVHSFYVPAFRIKQDVLPGRYTTEWFQGTMTGEYHLFCAEYCGTGHSAMIGKIIVMEPADYQAWLSGTGHDTATILPDEPMRSTGQRLFAQYGCQLCHGQRGPTMAGLFGRRVQLSDGSSVIADENYLRESILSPSAKLVAGFPPIMPTYQGQLSEEQVMQLIEYIKSLQSAAAAPQTQPTGGGAPR